MAWNVYAPKPRRKKSYSFKGWMMAPHPRRNITSGGFIGISSSRGRLPGRGPTGLPFRNFAEQKAYQAGNGGTTTYGGGSEDQYPGFYDPYSSLLAQLASARESDIGQLRGNLTGREAAISKLYAAQDPLVTANYGQAIKESAAVNDAVANQLKTAGQSGQADLLGKLALISAAPGATAQASGDVSKYYSGLGGANYAMDAGDVQRLIGRQSEEREYMAKQPGIIAQQLESEYASDLADLIKSYREQEFGLKQQQGESKADYEQRKWEYGQGQKEKSAQTKQDNEDRYWENYWKKRDEAFKRWEVQQTLGQKTSAAKTKAEIDALDRQAKIDVANIRAGATVTAAQTRAAATVTAAGTRAGAGSTSNINQSRAYQAALNSIIDPKSGNIRKGVNPSGYNAELTMQGSINDTLRGLGINPFSAKGTAIRRSVMRQANNRKFSAGGGKFKYDPKWASKLKRKKKPVKRRH